MCLYVFRFFVLLQNSFFIERILNKVVRTLVLNEAKPIFVYIINFKTTLPLLVPTHTIVHARKPKKYPLGE